jgi:hypothetical protein
MSIDYNKHALTESGLTATVVETITGAGAEEAGRQLAHIKTERRELAARSAYIRYSQKVCEEKPDVVGAIKDHLRAAAAAEKILTDVSADVKAVEKEAEAQIYFSGTATRPLNMIPYIVMALAAFKIYVAPVLALCLPLIVFIMPYVLLTSVMNMPVPWETYKNILSRFVLGIDPSEPWSLKQVMKLVWGLASFGQGIIQPSITAYHTWKLRSSFLEQGLAVQAYVGATRAAAELYGSIMPYRAPYLPPVPADPYVALEWWKTEKTVVEHYRSVLGWIDVMVVFGSDRAWRPVVWLREKSEKTTTIRGFYDVNIPVAKAVRNDITIRGHALVTGPNRGGKSSVMRGILQAVLSAQTWGVVHNADDVLMTTPYSAFYTRLVSADRPGVASLFESDVHYALDVLRGCDKSRSRSPFIMIDELFHSTNPADAEASATYFLRQLWKTGASSLISTHIFNLLEKAPVSVGRLCLKASKRADGTIEYTYRLGEGTCTVSSVGEVWTSVSACASAS